MYVTENKKAINELTDQHRDKSEKYVYYKVALGVACIGYSIQISFGDLKHWIDVFLVLSIFAWAASVALGLYYIRLIISLLHNNVEYLRAHSNLYGFKSISEEMKKQMIPKIEQGMSAKSKKAGRCFIWQEYLLYTGMLVFIVWFLLKSTSWG